MPQFGSSNGGARDFPRRRFVLGFAGLGVGALAALAGMGFLVQVFIAYSWPHRDAPGDPQIGINFSCRQAEYLLLQAPGTDTSLDTNLPGRPEWCANTLGTILEGTGARWVRLSVEWSEVEPRPGVFDFATIDALLAQAARDHAMVLLTVGVKAQRSPEFYIPTWVMDHTHLSVDEVISNDPYLRHAALAMVQAVVAHTESSPALGAWEADNEPYVASQRSEHWTLGRDFVQQEAAIIRATDPRRRRVAVNHAQWNVFDRRWQVALADGDVLAASIYPFRYFTILGHELTASILEFGPITPNYPAQARAAHAEGKPFWITEMQAEPWVNGDLRLVSPQTPASDFSHANFAQSIDYARRSGADRIYLWGAEWWYYEKVHFGDASWWDEAKAAIAHGSQGQ